MAREGCGWLRSRYLEEIVNRMQTEESHVVKWVLNRSTTENTITRKHLNCTNWCVLSWHYNTEAPNIWTSGAHMHGTVLFLGTLRFVGSSYIPQCRGKFALSESTVSKFGKIFHFPAKLLN